MTKRTPRTPRRKRTPRKSRTPRAPRLAKTKNKKKLEDVAKTLYVAFGSSVAKRKRLVACKCLCALAAMLLLPACARFHTTQTDSRKEWWEGTNQFSSTVVETKAGSSTFFSAKSDLANFEARQTEKSQGAKVGTLVQQGGTNAVEALREIANILRLLGIKGATGL